MAFFPFFSIFLLFLDGFLYDGFPYLEETLFSMMFFMFIGFIYYIFKIITSLKQEEVVELGVACMKTRLHGKIFYEEIESYKISQLFTLLSYERPAPGLRIKLKNNKFISYDYYPKKNDREEEEVYFNFIDAFMDKMRNFDGKGNISACNFYAYKKMKKAKELRVDPPLYLGTIIFIACAIAISLTTII